MPSKPVVMVDFFVLLDVLQKREPFFESSTQVLSSIECGKVKGYMASHAITTLYHLIRKDRSSSDARATITNLLQFLKVAPIDQSTIEQALNLDYPDYEDAVQMICAVQCGAEYLITRNVKDFQPSLIPVLQPVEFLSIV